MMVLAAKLNDPLDEETRGSLEEKGYEVDEEGTFVFSFLYEDDEYTHYFYDELEDEFAVFASDVGVPRSAIALHIGLIEEEDEE